MPRGRHSKRWWQRPEPLPEEGVSPRREAQRDLRRRKRSDVLKRVGIFVGGALIVAALGWGIYSLFTGDDENGTVASGDDAPVGGPDKVTTLLLFGTREKNANADAQWMTLLSYDDENDRGAVVYMPAHTAAEVPGRGLLGAGEAYSSGGVPLLLSTTENLLGIEIDNYLEMSDSDSRLLFEATGPISVDVPSEVEVEAGPNEAQVLFPEGLQQLDPTYLKKLLYFVGLGEDEAELGARHLAFWDGLFTEFAENPDELSAAVKEAGAALGETDMSTQELAGFFAAFAALDGDRRTLASLPSRQVSVGGEELYEVDHEELVSFLEETIAMEPVSTDDVRVQVLNGNGVPGIGEEVAERLHGEDFRVILSGNARRLDYKKTLIVTYDESDAGVAEAERAKGLLGVGEVQVSAQGQGIVDLTIVVGKDFVRAN